MRTHTQTLCMAGRWTHISDMRPVRSADMFDVWKLLLKLILIMRRRNMLAYSTPKMSFFLFGGSHMINICLMPVTQSRMALYGFLTSTTCSRTCVFSSSPHSRTHTRHCVQHQKNVQLFIIERELVWIDLPTNSGWQVDSKSRLMCQPRTSARVHFSVWVNALCSACFRVMKTNMRTKCTK